VAILGNYAIQIDQGADFVQNFIWKDGTGTPVDMTGWTAKLMIRELPADATALVSISTTPNTSGSIVLGGTAGTIQVNITNLATSTLLPILNNALVAKFGFDMYLTDTLGEVRCWEYGPVTVRAAFTH
jgi:hypothetical protein